MEKLLTGNTRFFGTVLSLMDANFIAVLNALVKVANPILELKGYADNANEPVSPAENDCYLVLADGTVWDLEVEKDNIITRYGSSWVVEPFKITELNDVFQALFFEAENIAIETPYGMTATNVQDALDELAAAVFGENSGS